MYKYLFFSFFLLSFFYSCNNIEVLDQENHAQSADSVEVQKVSSLNDAALDRSYMLNLRLDSHLIADEFFIYEGELPNGLELDSSTGVISGTPTKLGKFNFKLALKNSDSEKMKIIPLNISVDKLSNLYKNIESFIDISKVVNSTEKVNKALSFTNDFEISFPNTFFYFYGQAENKLRVCKQGYINVGGAACNPDTDIRANKKTISPFADKNLILKPSSKIYYQVRGQSPRQMLIIQYKDLASINDNLASYNFEVIIHEDTSNIQFLYDLSYSGLANDKGHLGTNAHIGVASETLNYEVTKDKPNIFRGTVITLHAPEANTSDNYNNNVKWSSYRYITSNVVTDFVDIARYNLEAQKCTSNSSCPYTNICIDGHGGKRCGSKDLTNLLMYDGKYQVKLPFIFKFYGSSFNDFYVNENGYIYFGSLNNTTPRTPQPNNSAVTLDSFPVNNAILPMFSEINIKIAKGGHISYNIVGKAPNRRAIVLFDEVRLDDGTTNVHNCTFELALHEGSNVIEFLYGGNNESDLCLGMLSTVGIKKDNTDFAQISANNRVLGQGKSVTFVPDNLSATSYTWVGVGNEVDEVANSKQTQSSLYGAFNPELPYWLDISAIGTRANISSQDHASEKVNIGFPFSFMGSSYNDITISTNGVAILEPGVSTVPLNNNDLNAASFDNMIALFWDNLYSADRNDPTSGIFHHTMQNPLDSTKKIFILSYQNVRHFTSSTSHIDAQMILSEGSTEVLFCYKNLSGAYSKGESATIGIKMNNTKSKVLSFNTNGIIQEDSCFIWTAPSSSGDIARNLYKKEINEAFIDIPLRNIAVNPVSLVLGEDIEASYAEGALSNPYAIYDLTGTGSNSYAFDFKGETYDKLFIDAQGAVSFGNNDTGKMVITPQWGDVYYQSELESLKTPYEDVENDFMWIANSGNGTLSRIDTHNGQLLSNHSVGSSPSRTAVGFDGSVWVGNRNSHDVYKLDRNGNFICKVYLHSGCGPRGLALDKDENLWAGCYYGGRIYKITDTHVEPSSENNNAPRCKALDIRAAGDNSSNLSYKGSPHGTYGFAFDKNGILWSSGLTNQVIRIDTNKTPGSVGFFKHFPMGLYTYGIVVDYSGYIWHARYMGGVANTGVLRSSYNESTGVLTTQSFPMMDGTTNARGRGVAIDRHGNIWVAYSNLNKVGKFAPDGTALGLFSLSGNTGHKGAHPCNDPIGIGVDGDGDVWANCRATHNSEEIDPNTGDELNNFNTGPSPYCYSDNTGFSLRNITSNLKKAQYYATIATEKILDPSTGQCARIDKKLVVQWNNMRLKATDGHGYTESSFQIIFDNGRSFISPGPNPCDLNNLTALPTLRDVKITYAYGSLKGSDYNLKTGSHSITSLKARYGSANIDYNHVIGDKDAGTVNSGSKFVISSSK